MGHTMNRVKCQVEIGWQMVVGGILITRGFWDSSVYIGTEKFYST